MRVNALSCDITTATCRNANGVFSLFTGAAIVVIMVIAVIIGLLIFIGGLIYLKR